MGSCFSYVQLVTHIVIHSIKQVTNKFTAMFVYRACIHNNKQIENSRRHRRSYLLFYVASWTNYKCFFFFIYTVSVLGKCLYSCRARTRLRFILFISCILHQPQSIRSLLSSGIKPVLGCFLFAFKTVLLMSEFNFTLESNL